MTWRILLALLVAGCSPGSVQNGDGGEPIIDSGDAGDPGGDAPEDGTAQDADAGLGDDTGPGDDAGPGDDGGDPGGTSCSEIVTFETGLTPTAEIHVAEGGNGDGSAGNPYGSIERAVQDAGPGTAIRVHAGTYPGGVSISNLSGQPGTPIWIGGAPGESKPIIDGGNGGMHLVKVRYLILHDL